MFFDEISPFLHDHVLNSGDLLILGDVNLHMDIPDKPDTIRFNDILKSLNLTQHVTFPTHRSNHTLDVVLTRSDNDLLCSIKSGDQISDHNLVVCQVHHPKPSPLRVQVSTRKLRDADAAALKSDIAAELKSHEWHDMDVVEACDYYHSSLVNILDKHAPLKTITVTIRPSHPWFSDELRAAKCRKRKAERKWRVTKLTVHEQIYRDVRDEYNCMLKKAQKVYYTKKIEESRKNPRELQKMYTTPSCIGNVKQSYQLSQIVMISQTSLQISLWKKWPKYGQAFLAYHQA